jgi:hypothetical protein
MHNLPLFIGNLTEILSVGFFGLYKSFFSSYSTIVTQISEKKVMEK